MAKTHIDKSAVHITVDGASFVFRPGDLTGVDARKVRAATGTPLRHHLAQLFDGADLDTIAAICYAAEVQNRGKRSFGEIEESITYTSKIDIEVKEDDNEGEA